LDFRNFIIILILLTDILFAGSGAITKCDTASSAMVVAAHPEAAKVGIEILKKGGNAVDAAVATAFVIGVVEPHASGLGGGGGMLIYLKDTDSFQYIDYYMQTSLQADTAYSRDDLFSPRSICIPGTPSGLITAVKQFGKLPLKTVIEPAIKLAKEGFIVTEKFYTNILDKLDVILTYPQTSILFLKDDFPVSVGDTLKNPQLAKVLEKLAENGEDYFYRGEFAQVAVKSIQENGGYITSEDFELYKCIQKEPVQISYRDYQIYSAPPPQSGVTLLEILNIYENAKKSTCKDFNEDANSIHILCESIKRADADRFFYLGDPSVFNLPITGLLDENYTKMRFDDIDLNKVKYSNNTDVPVGDPWKFQQGNKNSNIDKVPEDRQHTTHISVIDKDGNAVSLTQTLGLFFGSGFSSQGVVFNSAMSIFYEKPSPNRIGPGRRPMTTISPTMVKNSNNMQIILGTPGGGSIFNVLAQVIIRLLDFDQSPIDAMDAPRFNVRIQSKSLQMEQRFAVKIISQLENKGYKIHINEPYSSNFGGIQMIVFDQALNKYIGVSDPRRDGGALGY